MTINWKRIALFLVKSIIAALLISFVASILVGIDMIQSYGQSFVLLTVGQQFIRLVTAMIVGDMINSMIKFISKDN